MKRVSYILSTALVLVCACNTGLDIQQQYSFDLHTLPVPERIVRDETVEIRCQLVKEGDYTGTAYAVRYFQPDGRGELRLDDGRQLTPNDLFSLERDTFRLYYTSRCTDAQTIDIYIEDSFGQMVQQSFNFQNENGDTETEPEIQQKYSFDLHTLPVPERIVRNETVEIRCQLVKKGNYAGVRYAVRYFQPDGKGELRLDDGRLLTPNDLFSLERDTFRLYYTSRCTDAQTIDIYIEDSFGQMVQQSFNFQNENGDTETEPEIQQKYSFDLHTLPVPERIVRNETVEIRCQLVKKGNYAGVRYAVRYFQPDGKGELRLDDGRQLTPNDLFSLERDTFRLYYTSRCTDAQTVDIYIEDSFGQLVQRSFNFQNENGEPDTDFELKPDLKPEFKPNFDTGIKEWLR